LETKKQYIRVIEKGTNNESILIRDIKPLKSKGKKFVKLFDDLFPILPNLTLYETKILFYIISNLKMKSKTIAIGPTDFDFHKQTFYKSIKGLIEWDIITKHPNKKYKCIYLINTNFIFNGKI